MALFKRNKQKKAAERNPGDSQGQRVISYYTASRQQLDNFERRSQNTSDSLAFSRTERLRSHWFTIVICVTLAAALLYLATLSPVPHVVIQGTVYRSASEYQSLVKQAFGSDIRNRLKPTLQKASLEKAIAEAIPEATTVSIKSSLLGHRPEVVLVSAPPMATFTQAGNTSLIISQRGRLLLPSGTATIDQANLPILQNQTTIQGKAGEQFMRPDEAKAYQRLLAQYKQDNSTPVATLTTIPHEITIKEAGRGYYVRYLLDDTILTQYGSLRAVENKLKENNQKPNEYIDVRLTDKVYFK
ncbi:MAG: hypothetical protein U0491_02170 [Candidatus Saccharimonadales bacterium]